MSQPDGYVESDRVRGEEPHSAAVRAALYLRDSMWNATLTAARHSTAARTPAHLGAFATAFNDIAAQLEAATADALMRPASVRQTWREPK